MPLGTLIFHLVSQYLFEDPQVALTEYLQYVLVRVLPFHQHPCDVRHLEDVLEPRGDIHQGHMLRGDEDLPSRRHI